MIPSISPREAGRWTIAHALAKGEEYLFDYLFYPFMLYAGGGAVASFAIGRTVSPGTGYWTGFGILLLCSTGLNIAYVRLYDRAGTDWFGFERLRQVLAPRRLRSRVLTAALRFGVFCYLSIGHSPLFATLWARSRTASYRMQRSDWLTFFASIALANVGWTGCISVTAWIVMGVARAWQG